MTSFYEQAAMLDKLKDVREPTPEEVATVLALLQSEPYSRYFFHALENPAWLEPLRDRGVFSSPPAPKTAPKGGVSMPRWEASEYLIRVAHICPKVVMEIALSLDTDNTLVLDDLAQAALRMPPAIAQRIVPAIKSWLTKPYAFLFPERAAQLMMYLAKGGQLEAAMELLEALTEPTMPPSRQVEPQISLPREAEPRIERYQFGEMLREQVPKLAEHRLLKVLEVLEKQLTKAIDLEEADGKDVGGDLSLIWRPAIEPHPQNWGFGDLKNLLLDAVRDCLERISRECSQDAHPILEAYLTHPKAVFRRLAIHAIRLNPDKYSDLLRTVLQRRQNLYDTTIHHEFFRLMEDAFPHLARKDRERLLRRIRAGPLRRGRRRGHSEDEERHRKRRVFERLWALRKHLPKGYLSQLRQLELEFKEPEHPDFLSYHTEWVGPESPKSKEGLVAMQPEELVQYLREWQPPPEEGFGPSREGLGRMVGEVVKSKPMPYAEAAPIFAEEGISPTYIYHLIDGLCEAWRSRQDFDWRPVLMLCEAVIKRVDTPHEEESRQRYEVAYKGVRSAVARLLGYGMRDDEHALPAEYMPRARDLLLQLIWDPDPTQEEEQQSGYDPSTASLNCVRGQAMHALIQYAFRRARLERRPDSVEQGPFPPGERLELEVKRALTDKLDKTEDPSPAVHSVFGQYLPVLYYLDQEWVRQSLDKIFPPEPKMEKYWAAAWDAYISFAGHLWKELYELLKPHYRRAIEELGQASEAKGLARNQDRLAEHLMIAYLRELEELEGHDYLLPQFYRQASTDTRAHAVWFLWRVLENEKPPADSALWQRFKNLWEARVRAAANSAQPSDFGKELSAFAWWLKHVPVDLAAISHLVKAIIPYLEMYTHSGDVLEYLAGQATTYPQVATELLALLIECGKERLYAEREQIRKILAAAMKSGDENARSQAVAVINQLGERGDYSYRDLLEI